MSKYDDLMKNAQRNGQYLLLDADEIEELFVKAGFKDDERRPSTLEIEGKNYLFTGWIYGADDNWERISEFVLVLDNFTPDEIDRVDFVDFLEDGEETEDEAKS